MEVRLHGGPLNGENITLDRASGADSVVIAVQKWGTKTVLVSSPFATEKSGRRPRPNVETVLVTYTVEGRFVCAGATLRHSALEAHA